MVIDQSDGDAVAHLLADFSTYGARRFRDAGRGYAHGLNVGLRAATHDVVAVTNDDCVVRDDWIGVVARCLTMWPDSIVTGQVRPGGDEPFAVPSTKVDPEPHDYTGEVSYSALYGGNMAFYRRLILDLGGFDERAGMRVAAEDCDMCYRWLNEGRPLHYVPDMVVWHNDWRTPRELADRYVAYARGQGVFYMKHLRAGDKAMRRFILRDLREGAHATLSGIVRRRPRWTDERRGVLRGLPAGLVAGWLEDRHLQKVNKLKEATPPTL